MLAVIMAALAPAVSHALGKSNPRTWMEICTSAGSTLVAVDGEATGQGNVPGAAHLLEHCPFCSFPGGAMGMPPASGPGLAIIALPADKPAAFLHATRTLEAWVSAQPRAPPFLV
jgi:hypothetical protein